jgi:hypothetical protein
MKGAIETPIHVNFANIMGGGRIPDEATIEVYLKSALTTPVSENYRRSL